MRRRVLIGESGTLIDSQGPYPVTENRGPENVNRVEGKPYGRVRGVVGEVDDQIEE